MRRVVANEFKTQHLVPWDSMLDAGLALTGAEPPVDPQAIQDSIEACMARFMQGEDFSAITTRPADALGILWGWSITSAFEWKWKAVDVFEDGEPDEHDIGICDQEFRYLYFPVDLFRMLTEQRRVVGPKQRFLAIKNGRLRAAEPGAFFDLGSKEADG